MYSHTPQNHHPGEAYLLRLPAWAANVTLANPAIRAASSTSITDWCVAADLH
jgi:hypothetical protein